ncbi:MAG TPA: alpha-amylase family protein [Longimicrobiales bacterium]|nr:alpha-amylase family protein [Longimicrobiales bacterium]
MRPSLPATYRPTGLAAEGAVFVHLFEWRWSDVATECETVLGPAGVEAVQVSPPQEHALVLGAPWWQRYQPVSYALEGRSGSPEAFADMVARCAAAGVGIYVDAVLNHMTAGGGTGSAGTAYTKYDYTGVWGPGDFHPACAVTNYQSAANVQDCELLGLADLDTGSPAVRAGLADYLVRLVELGVAGFRLDAAKHVQPVELDSIVGEMNRRVGAPAPYVFGEVIDFGGEAVGTDDYLGLGYASGGAADLTEFRFTGVRNAFTGAQGGEPADLLDVDPGTWGLLPSDKAVVFIENHDTQREPGALTVDDGAAYRLAQVWLLAQPYGYPKVMSSYVFTTRDQGPPNDAGGGTLPVSCPMMPGEVGPTGWVCEHRDPAILGMVGFRRATAGADVGETWTDGGGAVAFTRGARGFAAFNLGPDVVLVELATGLPEGTYCDVIAGPPRPGGCAGGSVSVGADGAVSVEVPAGSAVAFHVEGPA